MPNPHYNLAAGERRRYPPPGSTRVQIARVDSGIAYGQRCCIYQVMSTDTKTTPAGYAESYYAEVIPLPRFCGGKATRYEPRRIPATEVAGPFRSAEEADDYALAKAEAMQKAAEGAP